VHRYNSAMPADPGLAKLDVVCVAQDRSIAVIDDDDPFRVALIELLGGAFCARGFKTADEFIATANVDLYDCIITDIQMPGTSGIELVRVLRAKQLRTPVILVTAHIDPASEFDLQTTGATCVLFKPFNSEALTACLEKALGNDPAKD
jgi:FixJ family two-component response regulator